MRPTLIRFVDNLLMGVIDIKKGTVKINNFTVPY